MQDEELEWLQGDALYEASRVATTDEHAQLTILSLCDSLMRAATEALARGARDSAE